MPARLPFTSWSSRGSLPELVRTMPARQLIYLWLAIFATFSMLGFALDILTRGRQPATLLALNVIFSGGFAVGYAFVSMPIRRWGYVAMVTGHLAYVVLIPRVFGIYPTADPASSWGYSRARCGCAREPAARSPHCSATSTPC